MSSSTTKDTFMKFIIATFAACAISSSAPAATEEDYLKTTDSWVTRDMTGRWEKMVNGIIRQLRQVKPAHQQLPLPDASLENNAELVVAGNDA